MLSEKKRHITSGQLVFALQSLKKGDDEYFVDSKTAVDLLVFRAISHRLKNNNFFCLELVLPAVFFVLYIAKQKTETFFIAA